MWGLPDLLIRGPMPAGSRLSIGAIPAKSSEIRQSSEE